MPNPAITVEFLTDTAKLTKGLNDAEGKSKSLGSRIGSLGKVGAVAAGAAGVGALVATLKIGIGEFAQAQKVAAQTNAVIKSTGGVAKVSAGHVDDLAGSLMKKSGVDDEAIASGENLLLTFTGIRNEVGKGNDIFDQATKAALDMSVALGTDMNASAMTLGKALNDPLTGMTKLTKQGVTFTDAQKKSAEAMVKHGDVAGAQALILAELNKEFGGSAEAAGKTLPGMLNIAKQSFSNFAGELVAKAIPVLQIAIGWLRDHWPEIQARLQAAWDAISPILVSLGDLVASVATLIKDNWGTIGPVVNAVFGVLQTMLTQIGNIIKLFVAILRGDWGEAWEQVKNIVKTAFELILKIITLYGAVGGLLWKAAKAVGAAILGAVVAGLEALPGALWTLLKKVPALWLEMQLTIIGWGLDLAGWILKAIVSGLKTLAGDVWEQVKKIPGRLAEMIDTVKGWGADVGKWILHGVAQGLEDTADWLQKQVTKAFHAVIQWAKEALGISSPSTEFAKIGKWMVEGMVKGIGSMGGFLKDAVVKLAKEAPGKLLDAINPFGSGGGGGDTKGLVDQVWRAIAYAKSQGWGGEITSGFRTYAEQAALYRRYLAGGPLAAAPGTSNHERGQAIDVTDWEKFAQIMRHAPANARLYNKLGRRDPVHFSLTGYAKGGIVDRPTVALIGERGPEAVVPLGGGPGGIQVRVFIGETELRGMVRTEVVTENNQVARTLLAGMAS